jgi:hypothetical protein
MGGSVFKAVVTAGLAYLSGGTTLTFTSTFAIKFTAMELAVVSFVGSLALDFVAQAMAPKPKLPNLSGFESQGQERIRQFRQPVAPHRLVYGEFRLGGVLTFVEVSNSNDHLHMVVTMSAHPLAEIGDVYFNDEVIPADTINASTGNVDTGKYKDKVLIFKNLGDTGSAQPFPKLASAVTAWTDDHIQQNRAKVYLRLTFDNDKFPTNVPNISFWVKGKKVVDPRNSSAVAWDVNPANIIRDYMTTSTVDGGGGAATLEFDDTFTNAAANTSEEIVSTARIDTRIAIVSATSANVVSTSTSIVTLEGSTLQVFTGDRVIVSAQTSSIGGITAGTAYYVIAKQRLDTPRIQFASTYAHAIAGTAKTLTSRGEGRLSVVKTGEPRYTMNGLMQVDRTPADMITDALTSMAGRLIYASGQWRLLAGAYTAPTITLDEDDFISPISVQTKSGRRSRFNAVKGIYVTSLNLDQPADYPPVTNSVYETEDNSERLFQELDLPNTNRPHMAQRLAKIALERHRQMITFQAATTLTGLQLQAGDTVAIDNERFGWSAKVFDITEWKLTLVGDENPILGCEMDFREVASTVFDWNSGEETKVDPAPNSNLGDPFTVKPPEALTITEALYDTRGSAGVKARATISWTAPADQTILEYEVHTQQTQDKDGNALTGDYAQLGKTTNTFYDYNDIEPGIWKFKVKALNRIGVSSDFTEKTGNEIFGLLAPPTEPQNLTISAIGGMAFLRWDATPDLDVKVGGTYLIRHDRATSGANWSTSVGVGMAISGSETTASVPLKSGTYLMKAVDSSDIESTNPATVFSKQATAVAYTSTSTITESTAFPGSTTKVDVKAGTHISITGSGLVDSIADVSSVSDWDSQGGIVAEGTYLFSALFDWGSVVSKRYTSDIEVQVVNVNDLIDSRTANIDDWLSFDGVTGSEADARVYSRETDDDPTGSPTWQSWQLLESAELTARGVQFKCVLTTTDPAFDIQVSVLGVAAETVT